MRNTALNVSTFLATAILLCAPQVLRAEGDAGRGKTKAYTCTGCHGIPGYKNTYPTYHVPRLGGQSPDYVRSALNAYRSGDRGHRTMMLQAESLSTADMDDIATWLATLGGDPAGPGAGIEAPDKAAACVACHGADGGGADPMYPVLAGQHASYLAHTLRDYRDGKRRNAIMGGMAAGLTDEEIEALAAYYGAMGGLSDLSNP